MIHSAKEVPTKVSVQKAPKFCDWGEFLKLIRFPNLLIIVFTQFTLKIFLIDEGLHPLKSFITPSLFLISLATVLTAAGGYIINDYYDIKIDTVNKPERVVVGRRMRRRVALGIHFVLSVLGLLVGAYLGWRVFTICLMASFLLWLYSNQLKRIALVGNISIALLTGLSLVILAVYYRGQQPMVFIFTIFAFFISLIREIIKDMEDMQGDASFGCRTLPVIWGIRRSKHVVYVFFFTLLIILLSTYLTFPNRFILYLYVTVLPAMIWFFLRLIRADTRKDFRFLSNLSKAIMLLGVLSMMLV